MVQTGFYLGDRHWWVMAFLDIYGERDLNKVYGTLLASGCPDYKAREACMVLSREDKGYTFTNYDERVTVLFTSRSSSSEQAFDTILHEIKHLVEHVSAYYDVDPKEELSAYLQGEVGRNLFTATSLVICPVYHEDAP